MSEEAVAKGTGFIRKVAEFRPIFVTRVIVVFLSWFFVSIVLTLSVLVYELALRSLFGIDKKIICPPDGTP